MLLKFEINFTAGLVFQEFVTNEHWMHLDIAGVMENKTEVPYLCKGMSGMYWVFCSWLKECWVCTGCILPMKGMPGVSYFCMGMLDKFWIDCIFAIECLLSRCVHV